jgi:hypothetical protein
VEADPPFSRLRLEVRRRVAESAASSVFLLPLGMDDRILTSVCKACRAHDVTPEDSRTRPRLSWPSNSVRSAAFALVQLHTGHQAAPDGCLLTGSGLGISARSSLGVPRRVLCSCTSHIRTTTNLSRSQSMRAQSLKDVAFSLIRLGSSRPLARLGWRAKRQGEMVAAPLLPLYRRPH